MKLIVNASRQVCLVAVLLVVVIAMVIPSVRASERANRAPKRSQPEYAVLESHQVLTEGARSALGARGVRVVRVLGGGRYIVRGSAEAISAIPNTRKIAIEEKIGPTVGYSIRRDGRRDLRVLFREDVSLESARRLVADLGGEVSPGFESRFGLLRSLRILLPDSKLDALASDEQVAQVNGSLWPIVTTNAHAAEVCGVTPLHDAPYDLDGAGEIASVYEYGTIDETHREFGGRVSNDNPDVDVDGHKTHVAGTIGAEGIRPSAKGMAPGVSIVGYNLTLGGVPETKRDRLVQGITSDNNSISTIAAWYGPFSGIWTWYGLKELGGYNDVTAALDAIAIETNALIVTAAGNDNRQVGPTEAPYRHRHRDADPFDSKIYCFEDQPGFGCPTPECDVCETERHPANGPFGSVASYADGKNTIAVGATDESTIQGFSSTGPTKDGRIKPEVVAQGYKLLSTVPNNRYAVLTGTSMSAPVVTGIAALIGQQWHRLHVEPLRIDLMRALLIWGADDLGNPGPDYIHGFGLVNARASVDAIRDDATRPGLIRQGAVNQDEEVVYPIDVAASGVLEVVLVWPDPAGLPYDYPALVNDLDMNLVGADDEVIQPWVLDPDHPDLPATRGVNHLDNVEQIESMVTPGQYELRVRGTRVAADAPQVFSVVSTHRLENPTPGCGDQFEPNDSVEEAWPWILSSVPIEAVLCGPEDPSDDYLFRTSDAGTVTIKLTATENDLNAVLTRGDETLQSWNVASGATSTISVEAEKRATFVIAISATDPEAESSRYVLTVQFPSEGRRRPVGRPGH